MSVKSESGMAQISICVFFFLFIMVSNSWCAQEDYNGFYSGTYSGDDNGAWMIAIDISRGLKFFSYSTDRNQGDGGSDSFNYVGEVGTIGTYTSPSTYFNAYQITIKIDSSDGSVTGTWSDTDSADSGTLTATEFTSSDYVDQYVGTYNGTYIGDNSGGLVITVKSNGELNGDITGSVTIDGADYAFKKFWLIPDGYFVGDGDGPNDEEFAFWGKINGINMSGWWYSVTDDSGNFTASIGGDDGDDGSNGGGGGGGGGCFISTMNQ